MFRYVLAGIRIHSGRLLFDFLIYIFSNIYIFTICNNILGVKGLSDDRQIFMSGKYKNKDFLHFYIGKKLLE